MSSASWRVLRRPNFLRLWIGQMISFIGDYFYFLAIPIMIERLTGSAMMVGLAVISSALPMLLLGPVAGVFVDRWNRQHTMIVADILRGLLVLLCLLVGTAEQVWIYYGVGFLLSCVSRFFFPAQSALLPHIVADADDLLAANGLMQVIQTVGLVAGPALAGFTIGLWGEQVAFLLDSASFFISAVAIGTMRVPRPSPHPEGQNRVSTVWAELREGMTYLLGSRTMVGVLACIMVLQLGIGAINVIWVPYLRRTFGVGAEGLGMVDAAQGAGMVLGGVMLGWVASRLSKSAILGWSLVAIGFSLAGIGASPLFAIVMACSFGLGVVLVPANSAATTIVQMAVDDRKRGRVISAANALATAIGLLSMGLATLWAEAVGFPALYLFCGATAVIAGLLAWRIPEPPPGEEFAPDRAERRPKVSSAPNVGGEA